jgi:hypothetical protein
MFKKGPKFSMLRFIVLYAVCCLPIQAGAKEPADSAASSDWAVLPIIASTTETGLQLGVLTIYFFSQEQEESPPSRLSFAALATENEQYLASLSPEFYFWDRRYHLDTVFKLRDWPSNYYGIGKDTPDEADKFNADGREIEIELARRIRHRYALGLRYRFSCEDITSNPDGLLARKQVWLCLYPTIATGL